MVGARGILCMGFRREDVATAKCVEGGMNCGGRAAVRLKCRCRAEVVNPTGGEERLPTLSSGLDFVSSSPQGAELRLDDGVKTWPETQGLEDGVTGSSQSRPGLELGSRNRPGFLRTQPVVGEESPDMSRNSSVAIRVLGSNPDVSCTRWDAALLCLVAVSPWSGPCSGCCAMTRPGSGLNPTKTNPQGPEDGSEKPAHKMLSAKREE
jgi:hypothetical protein